MYKVWKGNFDWVPKYYENLCFGVHNDMENNKKITMEEDEDE